MNDIITAATFALLFLISLAFVGLRVSGLSSFIVTGGSMEPSINKGGLVLVETVSPAQIKVGDVITFQQYDQTTTHRVLAISESARGLSFKTKGDANVVADPEDKTFAGSVGVVRISIPLAGYLVAIAQAYWRLALTLVAAAMFFGCAGAMVFGSKREVARLRPAGRAIRVTVDAQATWDSHLAWLERSRVRAAGLQRAA